jgi:putative salt-induced outer membrane protein
MNRLAKKRPDQRKQHGARRPLKIPAYPTTRLPSHDMLKTIGLTLVFCLLAAVANAQDKMPPPSEFNADLGFVSVSGNTSVTTLSFGEKWIRRIARWQFLQEVTAVYGRTDGAETSNSWRTSLRGDYGIGSNFALYARAAFDRNKYAGIKSRFGEGLGVVAKLIVSDVDQLNLESGFEQTQQRNLDGTSDGFSSLRAASSWKHKFGASAYVFQGLEFLPNLNHGDDYRINSETTIVAPLSSHVAMKASYQFRFDNMPSLNAGGTIALQKSDRILSTGIQVTF